jgi:hypothetical protein
VTTTLVPTQEAWTVTTRSPPSCLTASIRAYVVAIIIAAPTGLVDRSPAPIPSDSPWLDARGVHRDAAHGLDRVDQQSSDEHAVILLHGAARRWPIPDEGPSHITLPWQPVRSR